MPTIKNLPEMLTLDDVMLVPTFSYINSRSEVDVSVTINCGLAKQFKFSNPIIPSNMETVTGFEMAKCIYELGGLGLVHRFMTLEEVLNTVEQVKNIKYIENRNPLDHIGFSVGMKEQDYNWVDELVKVGVKIICVDVAFGASLTHIKMLNYIHNKYPHVLIIGGNVATGADALTLWQNNCDIIKIGIGCGSICLTRINAGSGVPLLSSLEDVYEYKQLYVKNTGKNVYIISDGGCKTSGDIAKTLCFADLTMSGSLFSACTETCGDIVFKDNIAYKQYNGSSLSKQTHHEGVKTLTPIKGSAKEIFNLMCQGIRSACSYSNSKNLTELKEKAIFCRITNAGYNESVAHNPYTIKNG